VASVTEPSLALQKALRIRLAGSTVVTALVPAANILDRNERPEVFPCILLGEGQSLYADDFDTFHDRTHADIHVWLQELGTTGAKSVVGAIRDALKDGPLTVDGARLADVSMNARFLRDPNGTLSHAVVGIDAIVLEGAA
jgi:hypothetical protein